MQKVKGFACDLDLKLNVRLGRDLYDALDNGASGGINEQVRGTEDLGRPVFGRGRKHAFPPFSHRSVAEKVDVVLDLVEVREKLAARPLFSGGRRRRGSFVNRR